MKNVSKEIDENTPLLFLAGPMFMEQLLNILVNNIDTLMLSHHSEIAVGAVGNSNQVMFLMILLFNIIATATSVVVAQYLGAKQNDKMNINTITYPSCNIYVKKLKPPLPDFLPSPILVDIFVSSTSA